MIEDVASDAELICYELRKNGIVFESRCVADKQNFLKQLDEAAPDAIISDYSMPQFNALDALRLLRKRRDAIPFILVTGSQSEEVAVECLKLGADDYILKASLTRLPNALQSSLQRRKAEREMRDAEERIREQAALLNKAQDAIMVVDLDFQISLWNPSAERIYGWKAADALGRRADELLKSPQHLPDMQTAKTLTLRRGDWHGEVTDRTAEGREIQVESRWTLVRDQVGKPRSFLLINTDITEKKKLENHFLRAQRMESIGTLAGGIAHDLNNVLTPILVSLRLLREYEGVPNDILDTLEASAHRGASIVQQVLSFARGVEGEKAMLQVRHPLNEVLKIAKDIFPPEIQFKNKIERELWPVNGDATQLHQVFMNLLVNARDAMPNGGRLHVEADNVCLDENYARMQPDAKPGAYVVISVSDTGTGIPPGLLNKIFEPFFTTKEVGKGTGLGLSTSLGIVKSHGGFLTVYSEVGKGTCFKVYLPALENEEVAARVNTQVVAPSGRGETVLVVDDEVAVREIIKVTLENYGYKVLTAADGAEAVATFASKKREIKVVVVDAMMPYMDGPATVRALSKLSPQTRFVAISGLRENDKVTQMAELGKVAFLAKPFTTEQILKTLSQVLSNGAESQN